MSIEKPYKLSILIVDDSDIIIDRLREILLPLKEVHEVVAAGDYESAVDKLNNTAVDVVLLDIQMPGKNGIELLKHISEYHPAIQSVMLSNMASRHHRKVCRDAGAVDFIDKSGEFEQIPEVLKKMTTGS